MVASSYFITFHLMNVLSFQTDGGPVGGLVNGMTVHYAIDKAHTCTSEYNKNI